jgi:hypothetical protein
MGHWTFIRHQGHDIKLILLILLFAVSPASAQETENQFWPDIHAFVRLSGKTRLFFLYSATRQKDLSKYSDGQVGASVDFYTFGINGRRVRHHEDAARGKSVMIRAGYMLDRNPDSPETSITHIDRSSWED